MLISSSLKTLKIWRKKSNQPLRMKISREQGCKNFRMSCSRPLKGLNSCREVEALALRQDKGQMDQLPEDSMALEQDPDRKSVV